MREGKGQLGVCVLWSQLQQKAVMDKGGCCSKPKIFALLDASRGKIFASTVHCKV